MINRLIRRPGFLGVTSMLLMFGATAVVAQTPAGAAGSVLPSVSMPESTTTMQMFRDADVVVKSVMLLLSLASITTWTIWIGKSIELRAARRRLEADVRALSSASHVDQVQTMESGPARRMVAVAADELQRSSDLRQAPAAEGLRERVSARLPREELAATRRITRGTNLLASVGSTAPFVGLFGTVWGIMNSFIGISQAKTTNLAVVAPGIAEALLATAMGLVAAIPAVLIYNGFTRSIGGYKSLLGDASTAAMCLISREVERHRLVPYGIERRAAVNEHGK